MPTGYYDFAVGFIKRQYGPCPNPADDSEGEERWHMHLGLVAHAIGEYSQQQRYSLAEIEQLAKQWATENEATNDARWIVSGLLAWLAKREQGKESER